MFLYVIFVFTLYQCYYFEESAPGFWLDGRLDDTLKRHAQTVWLEVMELARCASPVVRYRLASQFRSDPQPSWYIEIYTNIQIYIKTNIHTYIYTCLRLDICSYMFSLFYILLMLLLL